MSKVLITGASGLVGSRFMELSKFKSSIIAPNSSSLDITQPELVRGAINGSRPSVVINFAAYTDVSEAENQRGERDGECWLVNVIGVSNILEVVKNSNIHFIQISTDYVISGDNPIHSEDQSAEKNGDKLTWYGFTKAEAERLVLAKLGSNATILRLVSPVRAKYSPKLDYLRKPLKLYDEGKLYPMFTDQRVSISFIDEICRALDIIIEDQIMGIFHASSADMASPFELISYLLLKARGVKNVVVPSSYEDFLKTAANPVRYPRHGGLGVAQTEKKLGLKFSTWKQIIAQLVSQGIEV